MLTLIYDRLTRQVFDDVMEVAWSTMWNVTDETAINCERFLDGHGMQYFLDCLKVSGIDLMNERILCLQFIFNFVVFFCDFITHSIVFQ